MTANDSVDNSLAKELGLDTKQLVNDVKSSSTDDEMDLNEMISDKPKEKKETSSSKNENDEMDLDAMESEGVKEGKTSGTVKPSYVESLVTSTLQSFCPPIDLVLYGVKAFGGSDVKGTLFSSRAAHIQKMSVTGNADNNLILNAIPSLATTIAYFLDNRKLSLAASATPALIPVIQNLMMKRKPFDYGDGETDLLTTGINLLPLIIEYIKPYINVDKFKESTDKLMSEAKQIGNNANPTGFNRNVRVPRYF